MGKFLKWLSAVLVALVILVVVAIALLVTFVSPNRLKPVLTSEVAKSTGRDLIIAGDLSWSFFPYLGVKVEHLSLGNPTGFKQKIFAQIAKATVGVKLLPLFHGQIESSGVLLDGVELNLVKNAAGQVNWSFSTNPKTAETQSSQAVVKKSGAAVSLAVSELDVTNTSVHYADEQSQQAYDVTNFTLHAKDINMQQSFPIKTAFDFAAKKPAASGHMELSGDAALNLATQIYTFRNTELTAKIQQGGKKINAKITGNLQANLQDQKLEWTDFKGQVENISLTGKMTVTQLTSNPVATGQMQILPFDLKNTLTTMGQPAPNLQAAQNVSGTVNFSASAKNVDVKSNLQIEKLQAAKIAMKNFTVQAHLLNGVLDLAPFSGDLYEGKLTGQAQMNLNAANVPVSMQAKLVNVQAEPLFTDLAGTDQKLKITGVGNFNVNVTTSAVDAAALTRNLNGTSDFNFNNGAVVGIDLGYMVDTAYALAKQKALSATNNNRTNFGNLTGTAAIHNGIVTSNDLNADSPRFVTKGKGTIDLVNQQIDYRLEASVKQRNTTENNAMNLYGISIPVNISGSLSNPSIRLDSGAILKTVAEQQIQKVSDKAKEKIQDQLNEKAGDLLKGLINR